jgi:hypothetical protein
MWFGNGLSAAEERAIRNAIDAHYRRRGVPEQKLDEMRWKWLSKKGWRAPQTH